MNRRALLITALLLATAFTLIVLRSQAAAPRSYEAKGLTGSATQTRKRLALLKAEPR